MESDGSDEVSSHWEVCKNRQDGENSSIPCVTRRSCVMPMLAHIGIEGQFALLGVQCVK